MMMMSFERVCWWVEKLIKPLQIPLNPTDLFICHSNKEERGPTRTRTTHNFFNWKTSFSSIGEQTFFFNWKSNFCSIENGAFLPLKTHYSSIQNKLLLLLRKVWSLAVWTHMDMMKSTAVSVFFHSVYFFPSRRTEAFSFDTEDPPYCPLHANFYTRTTQQVSLVAALWPTTTHT
jgi:hypothetical protein